MKWGVATLYYKSMNLGGLLQAYAVTRLFELLGFECEQMCYDLSTSKKKLNYKKQFVERLKKITLKKIINKLKRKLEKKFRKKTNKADYSKFSKQSNYFEEFRNMIPHSAVLYNSDNIKSANKNYDAFICGSDQVWAPDMMIHDFFTLDFAHKNKPRISIAASMGKSSLTNSERRYFCDKIKKIDSISVREKTLSEYLQKYGIENECILDPTLLLGIEEWKKIADYSSVPEGKYVLCYFLGDSLWQRRKAVEYAEKHKIKLVYLPYVTNRIRRSDLVFKDYIDLPAGPQQFIGLVENAECIFTDSFHAMMFSIIFQKDFFVFNRDGEKGSNTGNARIIDFLEEMNIKERFIDSPKRYNGNITIDYENKETLIKQKCENSYNWIKTAAFNAVNTVSESEANVV